MDKKVAVVTGASSGIGNATCGALLEEEYYVLANARTVDLVFKESDHLILNNSDMLNPETSRCLLDEVLNQWGKCDLLCMNAGIIESNKIEDIDIDKMCEMARLKVEMSFRLIYTFLKYFKRVGTGHIIITSSVLGTKTRENSGAYSGCNYALEALTESLRMELCDTDIKITCIEPGFVETGLHRDWEVNPKESLGISCPLQPSDIAETVIELLKKPDHIRIPKYMILPKGHKI